MIAEKRPLALYPLLISIICIIAAGITVLYFFSISFGILTILSPSATQALITAEATMLGFFGLIAIYLLTTFDNRLDKIEEQIIDSDNANIKSDLKRLQSKIVSRKLWALVCIVPGLGCLVISLLVSISTYGILSVTPSVNATAAEIGTLQANQVKYTVWPAIMSSVLLFVSIIAIFVMLIWIGTEKGIDTSDR